MADKPKKPEKKPNLENVNLGSGLAEQAKDQKVIRKTANDAALQQAMQTLVPTVKEVNPEKKYNSQYGKGGK